MHPAAASPEHRAAPDAGRVDPGPPFDVAPDDPRLPVVAEQLEARLARFCEGMPAESFARLVQHAARIRLRWPA